MVEHISLIANLLKNGVKENNIIREFDLIDYYMITQMSFKDILENTKNNFTNEEYKTIKNFILKNEKYQRNNQNDIKAILNEKVIIKYQKDEFGHIIPGSEEILENETKLKIINWLKTNKIPVNKKTYHLAYKRYFQGLINLYPKKRIKEITKNEV